MTPRSPALLCLVTLALGGGEIRAEDLADVAWVLSGPHHPSTLIIDTSSDARGTRGLGGELDLGLDSGAHLLLFGSRVDVPASEGNLDTSRGGAGFHTDRLDAVHGGLAAEQWGAQDEILVRRLKGSLEWESRAWNVALTPEVGQVFFYSRTFLFGRREVEADMRGRGAAATYRGLGPWTLGASTVRYQYSRDLTRLNLPLAQTVFSARSIAQSTALLDRTTSGRLQYDFSRLALGLDHTSSVLAVTRAQVRTNTLRIGLHPTRDLAVTPEFGQTTTGGGTATAYAAVRFAISW